jgi:transposase
VIADAPVSLETVEVSTGLITLEIGADIVLRVLGDVAVERVAALVRAMRGAA